MTSIIRNTLAWRRNLAYCLLAVAALHQTVWANGDIVTDGSMGGGVHTLLAGNGVISQEWGQVVGHNLFQSFSDFNIGTGSAAIFTENSANFFDNVIARISGNHASVIDGTLISTPYGHAAFYLINPNGLIFTANAQVAVPAALHLSTAGKIDFQYGSFSADLSQTQISTLTGDPVALGFLASNSANNGLILDGAQLAVNPGQTIDLTADRITLENTTELIAASGQIRLVAMQTPGTVSLQSNDHGVLALPIDKPDASNAGAININSSLIYAQGDGGGRIAVWGGDISLANGANVSADNTGNINADASKGIDLQSNSLLVDNSGISFDSWSNGDAGRFNVDSSGVINISNSGFLSSAAQAYGKTETLVLHADQLNIENSGFIASNSFAQGDSGGIAIYVDKSLTINGQGNTADNTGIFANAYQYGQAGNLNIHAASLELENLGQISSLTYGQGNAGSVSVMIDHDLRINGQGNSPGFLTGIAAIAEAGSQGNAGALVIKAETIAIENLGEISSSTFALGNAGNISVTTEKALSINGYGNDSATTGIAADAELNSSGNAGNINVYAGSMDIENLGEISSSIAGHGNAGSISVKVEEGLSINGQGHSSEVTGIIAATIAGSSGNAGNIDVRAGSAMIEDLGQISSATSAQGNAGQVSVTVDNVLKIDGENSPFGILTGIHSNAYSSSGGNAGSLVIKAGSLDIENLANISSDSYGLGKAGMVDVATANITMLNLASITSNAFAGSSGEVGDLNIVASNNLLLDHSVISIDNQAYIDPVVAAAIKPGIIMVTAPDIVLKNSSITTHSTGNVAAGSVSLNYSHALTLDPSYITTSANTGNGGAININGNGLFTLDNSQIKTSVSGDSSNGGNIYISAPILHIINGAIQANALGGNGGGITLNLGALLTSFNSLQEGGAPVNWQPYIDGFNVIQAASQSGISGTVNLTAPQLNLSGMLANLGGPQIDNSVINSDYCGLDWGSTLTSVGQGGLLPKGRDVLSY